MSIPSIRSQRHLHHKIDEIHAALSTEDMARIHATLVGVGVERGMITQTS